MLRRSLRNVLCARLRDNRLRRCLRSCLCLCRRDHGGGRGCGCAGGWSGRPRAVRDCGSNADGGTLLLALRHLRGRGPLHAGRFWRTSLRLAAVASAESNGADVLHTAARAPASLLRVRHTISGLLGTALLAHVVDTDRAVVLAAATAPSGLAFICGAKMRPLLIALLTHLTRAKKRDSSVLFAAGFAPALLLGLGMVAEVGLFLLARLAQLRPEVHRAVDLPAAAAPTDLAVSSEPEGCVLFVT